MKKMAVESVCRGGRNRRSTMRSLLCLAVLGLTAWPVLASDVPTFSLKDPADVVHTQKALEGGAVVLVTIPNAKHGDRQSVWSKHLKKSLPKGKLRLVVLEDLSQSNVKEKAIAGMKKKYTAGQETLLLVDETGDLRRALRITNDETAVLVFNKQGRLVHRVISPGTADEIVDAARAVGKFVKNMPE
jgi:hypothetical protein